MVPIKANHSNSYIFDTEQAGFKSKCTVQVTCHEQITGENHTQIFENLHKDLSRNFLKIFQGYYQEILVKDSILLNLI